MTHTHRCMRCSERIPCLSPERCKAGEAVLPRLMVQAEDGSVHLFEHVCRNKAVASEIAPSMERDANLRRKGWNSAIERCVKVAEHHAEVMKSEAAQRVADEIRAMHSTDRELERELDRAYKTLGTPGDGIEKEVK